eukprot:Awhi_evm1s11300
MMKGTLKTSLLLVAFSSQVVVQMVSCAPVSNMTSTELKLPSTVKDQTALNPATDGATDDQNEAFLGGLLDKIVDIGTDIIFGEDSEFGNSIDDKVDSFTDATLGDVGDDFIDAGVDRVTDVLNDILDDE